MEEVQKQVALAHSRRCRLHAVQRLSTEIRRNGIRDSHQNQYIFPTPSLFLLGTPDASPLMLELWTENYIWPLPRHEGHLLLEPLALGLEVLNRLQEQLVRVPLARRLDLEDEVIPLAAQLDLVRELRVAQALPADRVLHRVFDDGLHLALVALEVRARLGVLLGDLLQADDAVGEAPLELLRVGADDGPRDGDERQQAVRGGGDGRELGVVGADALVHVRHELDLLPRPQLRDQDVRVYGGDGLVAGEDLDLLADG